MLPTIRLMLELDLAMSKQNPALDEREMLLLREESEDLPEFGSEPVGKLLKLDLQLIAAMQESLKDTKYVKSLEDKKPVFDAKMLLQRLAEEKKEVTYWTRRLERASGDKNYTDETKNATLINLARIAKAFGEDDDPDIHWAQWHFTDSKLEANYKPSVDRKSSHFEDVNTIIQTLLPVELADVLSSDFFATKDEDPDLALEALRSSKLELKRLSGSKDPDWSYQQDFALTPSKAPKRIGYMSARREPHVV